MVDVANQSEEKAIQRDERGYFLPGNPAGPGRPKGSRNKLAEDFLGDLHGAWQKRGKESIEELTGEQLCTVGRKRLAFRVLLQDTDKTLTDAEVEAAVQQIVRILQEQQGATLRT